MTTVALAVVGLAGGAAADQPGQDRRWDDRLARHEQGSVPWQGLSPEERRALERHRRRWDDYPPERQQRLRRGARRYLDMPPERRRQLRRQRERYRELPPEERRRLREEYRREHR